jgi:transcriptional regulator with XRE-family HTH domain
VKLDIEKNFREVLKEIRKEKNVSQEKLAEICEMDRTYISMIERGVSSPTLSKLVEISKALEVPLSEIFERVEKKLGKK